MACDSARAKMAPCRVYRLRTSRSTCTWSERALAAGQSLQEYLLPLDRSRPVDRRWTRVRDRAGSRSGGALSIRSSVSYPLREDPWSSLTRALATVLVDDGPTPDAACDRATANAAPHRRSSTSKCSRRSDAKPRPGRLDERRSMLARKTWQRCRCSEHHINVCWNVVGRRERTSRSTTPSSCAGRGTRSNVAHV